MNIPVQLKSVLNLAPHQREKLAAILNVSASTVDRWASGAATPSARHRRALERTLEDFAGDLLADRAERVLSSALSAAREVMHRHGAASSRNDALDQISLLLICHLQAIRDGRAGLQHLDSAAVKIVLSEAVDQLRRDTSSGVAAAFARTSAALLDRPEFLQDLLASMATALEELEKASKGGRSSDFHELFVSFLSSAFHEEKEFAQYMTPREVTDFMTRVGLSLLPDDCSEPIVLDPSCGTGAFLTDFADLFSAQLSERLGEGAGDRWLSDRAPQAIIGVDTSERMIRLASASFVAEGLQPKRLYLDSALQPTTEPVRSLLAPNAVDLILTNPPFGAEHSRGAHGGGRLTSELLFLERYVEWLRPGGVALSIIPDSVLTNKGAFEAARAKLLTKAMIVAVISLPPVTFAASGTTTKTSILILKKPIPGDQAEPTFFAVVENVGFQVSARGSVRKRVKQNGNQLPGVADDLLFPNDEPTYGAWQILTTASKRWDAQFWNAPITKAGTALYGSGSSVLVRDVADLVYDRIDPKRLAGPTFTYIEISGVQGDLLRVSGTETPTVDAPSRARRRVRAGDVLISTVRPDRRTVGVVPPGLDGAVCTTGFAILRSKGLSPYVLASALRSTYATEQLVGVSAGVAYPAFDPEALPHLELRLGDDQWQEDCAKYGEALEGLDALRRCVFAD
jgi:predicted RNA methylase/transcriptional regulator with XRE-family HTH domain